MKKIPAKNYFLLLVLFVATAAIVFFAVDVYTSRTKKQYVSIMHSFITEIKLNDLNYYTIDNSPVVIYISDKTNRNFENSELEYKKLLTEYNIQNYFVYLDISNMELNIIEEFEKMYNVDIDNNNLPNLVVITEGKVTELYSSSIFNKPEIINFLEKNGVIESD